MTQTKDITVANPQGKASLVLLDQLDEFKKANAKAKDIPEWLADYFTSLLVLSASFQFKPIVNKQYYLYIDHPQWKLSLISPDEWKTCPYYYFATCRLNDDKSWSINPNKDWHKRSELIDQIDSMKREFFSDLLTDTPILESLPYYANHLSYYQRCAAFGLAHSLKQSLQLKLGQEASQAIKAKDISFHAKKNDLLRITK